MNRQEPETLIFPAQPPAPQPLRARSGLALLLLASLFLGTVVLGVWLYNSVLRGGEPPAVQPAPAPETTAAPPAFRAPEGAELCMANATWRIFRGTDRTSCGFAENVALEMAPHVDSGQTRELNVLSPVTGQRHHMVCLPEGDRSYTCRGGDNAVVVLEDRAARD